MKQKLFAILCLSLGTILSIWIAYNYVVEMQPSAEGRSPVPAILFIIALFYVGFTKMRRSDD